MKVYLLENDSTFCNISKKELNIEYIIVSNYKAISSNSILLYFDDYLNYKLNRELSEYCAKNDIYFIGVNIINNSIYVGPIFKKNNASLEDFIKALKRNNKDHKLLLHINKMNTYKINNFMDREFLKLGIKLSMNIIKELISQNNKSLNKLWSISREPLNIYEHSISLDFLCEDEKYYFNEKNLFKKKLKKESKRNYRLNNKINVDKLEKKIVDQNFGMCKHIYYSVNSNLIPMVCAESFIDGYGKNNSFGRANDFNSCRVSALLENLERYFNSNNKQGRKHVYGSYDELKGNAIHPSKFGLHEESLLAHPDFKFTKYRDNLKIYWIWAWSIKKSKYVLVPEQLIYYIDNDEISQNTRFVYDSSNGAALGSTLEEALLYGIFEIIERDNFFVSFYNELKLTEIDIIKSNLTSLIPLYEFIINKGYELHFYDMSMELKIPAIWCLMINKDKNALVKSYSAAGAHFNPEQALKSALIEVVTSVPVYEDVFSSEYYKNRKEKIFEDINKLTEFEDHVLYYSHNKSIENFNFILKNNDEKKSLQDIYPEWYLENEYVSDYLDEDIKCLITKILDYHEDIYIADLTSYSLRNIDLSCAKVLIPGMQPVAFGHQYRRIIKERIKKAPILANRNNYNLSENEINEMPHPFP